MSNLRITEDGDYRITEGGDYRILEGVDVGQVVVSSPAGDGGVSTNAPGAVGAIIVTSPDAGAVGYTSAVATGGFPTQRITGPTVTLTAGFDAEFPIPVVDIGTPLAVAGGGGQATSFGSLPQVTISSPLHGVLTGAAGVETLLPDQIDVSGIDGDAAGQGRASPDFPVVVVTPFEDDVSTGANVEPDIGIVGVSSPLGEGFILGEGGIGTITVSGPLGEGFILGEGEIGTITVSVPKVTTGKKIKVAEALFRGLENHDAIRQIKRSN